MIKWIKQWVFVKGVRYVDFILLIFLSKIKILQKCTKQWAGKQGISGLLKIYSQSHYTKNFIPSFFSQIKKYVTDINNKANVIQVVWGMIFTNVSSVMKTWKPLT